MRTEKRYDKLIGREGRDYYFLDYIFEDGILKGATGTIVEKLTEEEYDERVEDYFSKENIYELWQNAVENSATEMGLDDWIEMVRNTDGDEGAIEKSYNEKHLEAIPSAFALDIRGGGRCFGKNIKFDEVFDEELLKKIREIEA